MSTQPSCAGFSLIEVMVAILILGVALTGLTHGVTTALDSSKESEQQTTAALMASGLIETTQAEGGLADGETDGAGGPGLEAYQWQETIAPTDLEGLHEVDVVITDTRTGREIYELKTQLFEAAADTQSAQDKAKQKPHTSGE